MNANEDPASRAGRRAAQRRLNSSPLLAGGCLKHELKEGRKNGRSSAVEKIMTVISKSCV